MWLGFASAEVAPSPNSHDTTTGAFPPVSAALKSTVKGASPSVTSDDAESAGTVSSATAIRTVAESESPLTSVTVTVAT